MTNAADTTRAAPRGPTGAADGERRARIVKTDDEMRVAWGEVYVPGMLDTHGDFMDADTVRAMAYGFLAAGRVNEIDVQHGHDEDQRRAVVVESFVARAGDPTFIEGAWVMAVYVPDDDLWAAIKSGQLNGFSLEGLARTAEADLDLVLPDRIEGRTAETAGHAHGYVLRISEDGRSIDGEFLAAGEDDHSHEMVGPSVTGPGPDGHTHRFHLLDGIAHASAQG